MQLQLLQKPTGALCAALREDVIQGIKPFASFQYLEAVAVTRCCCLLLTVFQCGLSQFCFSA
jgi:hypothetical protein